MSGTAAAANAAQDKPANKKPRKHKPKQNNTTTDITPGLVKRTDLNTKLHKINAILHEEQAIKYWETLQAFLAANISRIELEKIVVEVLGDNAVLHNDIVLAVLHNAILATEGVVEADVATNVNNAVEKTKATHKNKKTDLDENAQGMPSLSLPSSNPAGNAKSRKDAKGKDNKKDSKHKEPSVKPVKRSKNTPPFRIFPHLPAKVHQAMQHFISKSIEGSTKESQPLDVFNTAFVTSLLHQTVSNFGITEVTPKAGELATIAVEIFLKSLLTKVVDAAKMRRLSECIEEGEELSEKSDDMINMSDLLAAAEQNPRILGLNGSAFILLEQIRIQTGCACRELSDSYLEG